jgi:hypothetical protein
MKCGRHGELAPGGLFTPAKYPFQFIFHTKHTNNAVPVLSYASCHEDVWWSGSMAQRLLSLRNKEKQDAFFLLNLCQ